MKRYKGIYFDHAATSYPKPRAVERAVLRAISDEGGNPGRSSHTLSLRAAERVFSARERIADFFGLSDSRGVVFVKNATEALNLAVSVLTQKGGHVLCDDMAHNALLRPLYALERTGKITLSFFSAKEGVPDFKDNTLLLCATHASNICSHLIDAERLGALCKERGVAFLLDASQSAGHFPIDCERIGADAVCLPAHKGLYGIMGAGAVLFPHIRDDYPVFLSGGSGSQSLSREMPRELPEHFEAGTLPLPAIAAFEAGVNWVRGIGLDEIRGKIRCMEKRLWEGLGSMKNITLHGDGCGGGILSFTHASLSPERVAAILDDSGIAVRAGLHCAPLAHKTLGSGKEGTVRISLGYTNTEKECEHFLKEMQNIVKNE